MYYIININFIIPAVRNSINEKGASKFSLFSCSLSYSFGPGDPFPISRTVFSLPVLSPVQKIRLADPSETLAPTYKSARCHMQGKRTFILHRSIFIILMTILLFRADSQIQPAPKAEIDSS
jgi:hypothetical protein